MKEKTVYIKLVKALLLIVLFLLLNACSTVLVAPYDEKLVTDTEAFYKKAAKIIEQGRAVSPETDKARSLIENPGEHKGHFSKFEAKYNSLLIDTESLILRAMASRDEIAGWVKNCKAGLMILLR